MRKKKNEFKMRERRRKDNQRGRPNRRESPYEETEEKKKIRIVMKPICNQLLTCLPLSTRVQRYSIYERLEKNERMDGAVGLL